MSDWSPQIVKIESVEKHPNADSLDIVTVLGDYPVITKRDEYKVGDLSAYLPIDTVLPDIEQFYFLCPKNTEKYEENGEIKIRHLDPKYELGSVPEKHRVVKAKKIRGIYSQGMLFAGPFVNSLSLGDSVVDILNLKKWEEQEEDNCKLQKPSLGRAEKAPSGWAIPYYDIEGIRKYIKSFDSPDNSFLKQNEEIVLTEKCHGSNAAFVFDGERLWCKSRNFYKSKDERDMWWDVALRFNLEEKLSRFPMMVFFGEVIGQVKRFKYDALISAGKLNTTVHFFDIWDLQNMKFLDYDQRVSIIKEVGLNPVPELYRGPWLGKEKMYALAEGNSTLNPSHVREGWVLNLVKERFEPLVGGRLQFKLVGEGYNLLK